MAIKNNIELDKFFSKELTHIFDYIIENVHKDVNFNEITPSIFLYSALENKETMLSIALNTYLISDTIDKIHDKLVDLENKPDALITRQIEKPQISSKLKEYLTLALKEVRNTKSKLINSDHVLLAILNEVESTEYNSVISDIFNTYGVTYKILLGISKNIRDLATSEIKNDTPELGHEKIKLTNSDKEESTVDPTIEIQNIVNGGIFSELANVLKNNAQNGKIRTVIVGGENIFAQEIGSSIGKSTTKSNSTRAIPYCTNLNDLAKRGTFDKLIGRENELNETFRVLGRRKTNNVILVGEQGVGKTQIVVGLAQKIINKEAPYLFADKEVWKYNPSEMMAGTTLRGMFEERMINMIKALKNKKNAILFIDDIDSIFSDKTKNDYDVGGIMSELFSDGDVQIIAATDFKGYKAICDTNSSIAKKLQEIKVDALNEKDTYDILLQNKKYYEDFHLVEYPNEVLKTCISLAKRYITEKTLPSSAIDIMDELGSYVKINCGRTSFITQANREIDKIDEAIKESVKKDDYSKVEDYQKNKQMIRINLSMAEEELRKGNKYTATLDDLYTTISKHTNIPINKIKTDDKKELKEIEQKLKNIIIGQDEAINVVSRAIKRNKIGLHQNSRPMACFMMVGTTGVGKTLLAKTLAKEIFGDEKYLIRFDMSEYNDKTSVNKLIGASAGYVGYNEGGLLTESIKQNKYAVLLIDEIEKATDEIYNLFLQVFDEGFLTDNMGQKVDFKNTIIILTSNVGTKLAGQHKSLGFVSNEDEKVKHNIITKELKNKFPPEFLNRLDEIVYFNNLTNDNLREIIRLELVHLSDRVKNIGYLMYYDDKVVDYLLEIVKKEKEYGARPVIRTIRDNIENKITDLIIDYEQENGIFYIVVENDELKITLT